ncbi:MAG TPA: hypothetical protein VFQ57_10280 [Sphingomonas sp.]|jgi:hypothetical protein|nr:hypothetical protein [Sphingomonas sp.]
MTDIDPKALDSLSVAPSQADADEDSRVRGETGHDKSIAKRLAKNPDSEDARLDNGLDESMDASDTPSITRPGSSSEPAPSSGYDEEAERSR